ncbi:hypothetical protein PoB_000846300 [Plakobranchus ocellatus]|uniref:Uncharacterized protein n=1 Tax=Plakobranchus ocellatus TaxID=259542 RepID=A0AAV3YHR4_9GAST|nr:hypothetical protein PoB_000846300 [Plakobranchus ocellatus]
MKPAALLRDGGRSALSAPPKVKKGQKDSPALGSQRAAETEALAKHRAKKSKRQVPLETRNCFAPLAMEAEETYPQSREIPPSPSSLRPSASPMECPPSSKPRHQWRNPKVLRLPHRFPTPSSLMSI